LNRVFGFINLDPNQYASKIRPDTKINQGGSGNAMIYPADLGPYYISFHFKKYVRPAPFVDASTEIISSIYLPLPRELIESHTVGWQNQDAGIMGAILDAAEQKAAGGRNDTEKSIGGIGAVATVDRLAKDFPIASDIAQGVEQSAGAAVNPIPSVYFKGPTLRQHGFTWEFNPNNPDESTTLKGILNEIKKNSLPALAIDGTAQFLAYPRIVEIRIHGNDDLILYKQAVVTNVSINYAPQGIPSFFKGTREPTFIGLSLSLQEIEYFLSEDFGGTSGERGAEIANQLNTGLQYLKDKADSIMPGAGNSLFGDYSFDLSNSPPPPPPAGG
jgi:hypothetical protein